MALFLNRVLRHSTFCFCSSTLFSLSPASLAPKKGGPKPKRPRMTTSTNSQPPRRISFSSLPASPAAHVDSTLQGDTFGHDDPKVEAEGFDVQEASDIAEVEVFANAIEWILRRIKPVYSPDLEAATLTAVAAFTSDAKLREACPPDVLGRFCHLISVTRCQTDALLDCIAECVQASASAFDAVSLGRVALCFGHRCGRPDPRVFGLHSLGGAVVALSNRLTLQHVARIFWGYTKAGVATPAVLAVLLARTGSMVSLGLAQADADHAVSILWCCANVPQLARRSPSSTSRSALDILPPVAQQVLAQLPALDVLAVSVPLELVHSILRHGGVLGFHALLDVYNSCLRLKILNGSIALQLVEWIAQSVTDRLNNGREAVKSSLVLQVLSTAIPIIMADCAVSLSADPVPSVSPDMAAQRGTCEGNKGIRRLYSPYDLSPRESSKLAPTLKLHSLGNATPVPRTRVRAPVQLRRALLVLFPVVSRVGAVDADSGGDVLVRKFMSICDNLRLKRSFANRVMKRHGVIPRRKFAVPTPKKASRPALKLKNRDLQQAFNHSSMTAGLTSKGSLSMLRMDDTSSS